MISKCHGIFKIAHRNRNFFLLITLQPEVYSKSNELFVNTNTPGKRYKAAKRQGGKRLASRPVGGVGVRLLSIELQLPFAIGKGGTGRAAAAVAELDGKALQGGQEGKRHRQLCAPKDPFEVFSAIPAQGDPIGQLRAVTGEADGKGILLPKVHQKVVAGTGKGFKAAKGEEQCLAIGGGAQGDKGERGVRVGAGQTKAKFQRTRQSLLTGSAHRNGKYR